MTTPAAEGGRATYLVEHYWPGITRPLFEEVAARVRRSADALAAEGHPIRFLHSTLVPEDDAAFCVFEAESGSEVERAYARAGVPFERVVAAHEFELAVDTEEGR